MRRSHFQVHTTVCLAECFVCYMWIGIRRSLLRLRFWTGHKAFWADQGTRGVYSVIFFRMYVVRSVPCPNQLDQKLNSVLSTILERSKSQSLKIDEALVGRLGTLRSDVHSDVESQLDALEPNLLESVEKVVREKLSTTTAAGGSCVLSEKDRGILNSLARNVAFMR